MFFFTLIFAVIEFCIVMFAGNFVATAAQAGSRYAMVRGSDWSTACASVTQVGCQASTADVQNFVLSLAHPGMNLTASNITVTPLTTKTNGTACVAWAQQCRIQVKVSYTYQVNLLVASVAIPLSSTSIETIQD
jgi:Flp pilus assembly protein TadG